MHGAEPMPGESNLPMRVVGPGKARHVNFVAGEAFT